MYMLIYVTVLFENGTNVAVAFWKEVAYVIRSPFDRVGTRVLVKWGCIAA
jgi:hypothetical protein